jgi:DNA-binding PadR family transcriptional regulator
MTMLATESTNSNDYGRASPKRLQKRKARTLPEHSHLQYAILGLLSRAEVSGVELRKSISELTGKEYSGPAFYQLMGRMVELQFVQGFDVDVKVNRYVAKERRYRILPQGTAAVKEVRHFYMEFV